MTDHDQLTEDDLRALATCANCNGVKEIPDIFGDLVLCCDCTVTPGDPFA